MAKPRYIVLTYEVDGRQATCLDPVCETVEQSLADLQAMYGSRLGNVWNRGKHIFPVSDQNPTP